MRSLPVFGTNWVKDLRKDGIVVRLFFQRERGQICKMHLEVQNFPAKLKEEYARF